MNLTQEVSHDVAVYRPRSPTQTSLYKLLASSFDHFERIYPKRFSKSHGFFRPVISHVVQRSSSSPPGQKRDYEPVDDGWQGYNEPVYGSD